MNPDRPVENQHPTYPTSDVTVAPPEPFKVVALESRIKEGTYLYTQLRSKRKRFR